MILRGPMRPLAVLFVLSPASPCRAVASTAARTWATGSASAPAPARPATTARPRSRTSSPRPASTTATTRPAQAALDRLPRPGRPPTFCEWINTAARQGGLRPVEPPVAASPAARRDLPRGHRPPGPRLRRGHGHADPGRAPHPLGLRRQGGGQRPPHPDPPRPDRADPRPLLRGRLRRGRDQHLRLVAAQARRVRPRPPHLRGQLPRRHPGAPRRRALTPRQRSRASWPARWARAACCPPRPTRRSATSPATRWSGSTSSRPRG